MSEIGDILSQDSGKTQFYPNNNRHREGRVPLRSLNWIPEEIRGEAGSNTIQPQVSTSTKTAWHFSGGTAFELGLVSTWHYGAVAKPQSSSTWESQPSTGWWIKTDVNHWENIIGVSSSKTPSNDHRCELPATGERSLSFRAYVGICWPFALGHTDVENWKSHGFWVFHIFLDVNTRDSLNWVEKEVNNFINQELSFVCIYIYTLCDVSIGRYFFMYSSYIFENVTNLPHLRFWLREAAGVRPRQRGKPHAAAVELSAH